MEAIIEKIKEYKIIVICTGLGLLVGGFFLLKPARSNTCLRKRICRQKLQLFQAIRIRKGSEEGRKGRTC